MNRLGIVALACLGLGLIASPLLQGSATSAVPANPKIGMIDIEDTLSTTPAGKRANDAFEKTRKDKQAKLDKQQEQLKKDDADLSKQQAVLKPEAFAAKRGELEKKFVDGCSRRYREARARARSARSHQDCIDSASSSRRSR